MEDKLNKTIPENNKTFLDKYGIWIIIVSMIALMFVLRVIFNFIEGK